MRLALIGALLTGATQAVAEEHLFTGRLDLRVLRGSVDSIPWHVLLTTRDDRGADLHRIVFIE